MIEMEQLILISGSGQNVGKTTLACQLIKELAKEHQVTTVKISSHKHQLTNLQNTVLKQNGLTISEELDNTSNKDSSLFLQYGASKSYFIQVDDLALLDLSTWMKEKLHGKVVCESGIIGKFIKPGKAIYLTNGEGGKEPVWNFEYKTVLFRNEQFSVSIKNILID